jgi:CubicO group peptidase (beta-lactamase class C family)
MNDPVAMYLPELADLKIYVSGSGETIVVEDAKLPLRIIDLFTHTAGFSYRFTGSEVDKIYRASPLMQRKTTRENVFPSIVSSRYLMPRKEPCSRRPQRRNWSNSRSTNFGNYLPCSDRVSLNSG